MKYNLLNNVKFIAIHCAATPATSDIGATEIDRWHRQRGFRTIGYHYVIRRDGTVEKGRDPTIPGAHERKINKVSLAVCLVGGSPPVGSPEHRKGLGENNYTPEQWHALAELVLELQAKHPEAEVLGHRDVPGVRKACPSFDVKPWWEQVRRYHDERGSLPKDGPICAQP